MTPRRINVLELRSVRGPGGGPEKTILNGAKRAADPFNITVCYLRAGDDRDFDLRERAQALGVRYVEIVERHSFDTSVVAALRRLIRDATIDIVHAHEYKTDLLAWWVCGGDGPVALATAHGWTGHSWRERRVYYPLDKKVLAKFPALVAVSSDIKNELVAHGAKAGRITTVLNGIDAGAFRRDAETRQRARAHYHLGADDLVAGSVGRLAPQKRFDLLVEAVAALVARVPRLKLLIAGEGTERTAIEATIARLGLQSRCRLVGHQKDVTAFYHALDVFVQSSDYEGTSNAVLEAMALETPVVATDAGGTAEIIRDGVDGLVVRRGDSAALASEIERALRDRDATDARVRSARHRVETDLSFDARTRAVERIYEQLMTHRR
jgi:glycosyltransferase involved in cell wall biosynthesis